MRLQATVLTPADVPTCVRFWGGREAYTTSELDRTGHAVSQLLASGAARGTVLRDEQGAHVAHAICAFVTEAFADSVLAAPHAHVGKRLLLEEPEAALGDEASIALRNAGAGLQMLAVNQGGADGRVTADTYEAIVPGLIGAIAGMHRGYRLARIINELAHEMGIVDVGKADAFAVKHICHYVRPDGVAARTLLAAIDRDQAMAGRGLLMPMFAYHPPVVGFSPAERALLAAAVHGATDVELVVRLGIPLSSVKARWKRIQARMAERAPAVLPSRDERVVATARGAQVRHVVLQFVREHPEELTPYARQGR